MPKPYIKLLGETSRPVDLTDPFDIRLGINDVINTRGYSVAETVGNRWRRRAEELTIETMWQK